MKASELIDKIALTHGSFLELNDDEIEWYAELDYWNPETQEPHDRLWEIYCETAGEVRPKLPSGWTITDTWTDNDSTGFTIKRNAQ